MRDFLSPQKLVVSCCTNKMCARRLRDFYILGTEINKKPVFLCKRQMLKAHLLNKVKGRVGKFENGKRHNNVKLSLFDAKS